MLSSPLELFICPSGPGASSYAACFGRGDMFVSPDAGDGTFFRNSRVRLRDIEDGPMTILVGERPGAHWSGVSPLPATGKPGSQGMALSSRARVLAHTGPLSPGKPVHLPSRALGCMADFGSAHRNGTNFLLVDGSVRFLSEQLDPAIFSALATRAGGEFVNQTEF